MKELSNKAVLEQLYCTLLCPVREIADNQKLREGGRNELFDVRVQVVIHVIGGAQNQNP